MKHSEKFWLHKRMKDYKESSNFAAENPKGYQPLGFPLLCVYQKNRKSAAFELNF